MMKRSTQRSSIFSRSAQYYDLIYAEKDYDAETKVLDRLIKRYFPKQPIKLLDLGCGTGEHLVRFARKGYRVTGIDQSASMLAIARKKLDAANASALLVKQNIVNFSLSTRFAVAVSLFHVMSYLRTNEEIQACFKQVRAHLRPGGIFIFDFWYGPGVVQNPPENQYRIYENDTMRLHRFKQPKIEWETNTVAVKHHTLVEDLAQAAVTDRYQEIHTMRFYFLPEMIGFLQAAGFTVLQKGALAVPLHDRGNASWDMYILARRD